MEAFFLVSHCAPKWLPWLLPSCCYAVTSSRMSSQNSIASSADCADNGARECDLSPRNVSKRNSGDQALCPHT